MNVELLFREHGQPNPCPKAGDTVLIEGGGHLDQAAFTVGVVINAHVGGTRRESRVTVEEKQVLHADLSVAHPRRARLVLPYAHFAKSIQERMRLKAEHFEKAARQCRAWANIE